MDALLLRRPRRGIYALATVYALYKVAPSILKVGRALRRLIDVADDTTVALHAAAREIRQQLEPGDHERPPPRALQQLLAALAAPDSLRILSAIVRAAVPRPSRPDAKGVGLGVDAVLRALDSPHGRRVTANVVAAATAAVVTAPRSNEDDTDEKVIGAKEKAHPIDKMLDAALSDRGRALVLDALGIVVRSAVPVLIAAAASKPQTTNAPSTIIRTPTSATPLSSSSTPVTPVNQSSETPVGVERVLARALRDRALVRDVVRVTAAEAVKAYLTTSARLRLAPASPSPVRRTSSIRRLPPTPPARRINPEPALWRTIGQAAANAGRRWLLRAADQNPQPSWILF